MNGLAKMTKKKVNNLPEEVSGAESVNPNRYTYDDGQYERMTKKKKAHLQDFANKFVKGVRK